MIVTWVVVIGNVHHIFNVFAWIAFLKTLSHSIACHGKDAVSFAPLFHIFARLFVDHRAVHSFTTLSEDVVDALQMAVSLLSKRLFPNLKDVRCLRVLHCGQSEQDTQGDKEPGRSHCRKLAKY